MTMAIYRRRILQEEPSRLAIWARRFAVFAAAVALLTVVIERSDLLDIMPVLVTFAAALGVAFVAILLALASFVMLWRNGGPGFGQAVAAVSISVALIAYPAHLGYKGYKLPALRDVTTDPIDPPRFEVLARLRPPNTSAYPGLATAELQKEAWPDIEPLIVSAGAKAAYDGAMTIIGKRKWRIVDARPPQPGREGRIEAIARTPIMGFRDDIVVRVRGTDAGAKVDIRSASRFGSKDFGANAERILALLDDIDDAASVEKREPPVRPPAKPATNLAATPQSRKR
jgi:hypothetical protein